MRRVYCRPAVLEACNAVLQNGLFLVKSCTTSDGDGVSAFMSDLSFFERKQLEELFQMDSGYVLDFSNRTFQEFVAEAVRKDIEDPKYQYSSGSKANRLRQFLKVEPNQISGILIRELVEYAVTARGVNQSLVPEGRKIAARLLSSAPVQEIDALQALTDERTFEALARSVRDAIENNEPESGLDRIHTFVTKYVRALCEKHGLQTDRRKPLHSSFGEYVKHLRQQGMIESEMTIRILKSCISTLEAFNTVRNEQSFAHDNTLLNYEESLLIFNNVAASIRFIESVEKRSNSPKTMAPAIGKDSDRQPF